MLFQIKIADNIFLNCKDISVIFCSLFQHKISYWYLLSGTQFRTLVHVSKNMHFDLEINHILFY